MALNDTLFMLEGQGWKTTQSFSNDELKPGGVYVAMFGHRVAGLDPALAKQRLAKVGIYAYWQGASEDAPNIYVATIVPTVPVTLGGAAVSLGAEFMVANAEPVATIPAILVPVFGLDQNIQIADDAILARNTWVYLYLYFNGPSLNPNTVIAEYLSAGYQAMWPPSGVSGLLVDDKRFMGDGYMVLMFNPGNASVSPLDLGCAECADAECFTSPTLQGLQWALSIVYYAKRGEAAVVSAGAAVGDVVDATADLTEALSNVTSDLAKVTAPLKTASKWLLWGGIALGLGYLGYLGYKAHGSHGHTTAKRRG